MVMWAHQILKTSLIHGLPGRTSHAPLLCYSSVHAFLCKFFNLHGLYFTQVCTPKLVLFDWLCHYVCRFCVVFLVCNYALKLSIWNSSDGQVELLILNTVQKVMLWPRRKGCFTNFSIFHCQIIVHSYICKAFFFGYFVTFGYCLYRGVWAMIAVFLAYSLLQAPST